MPTLHFKNVDIIQIIVETIWRNSESTVVRRVLIAYFKEHLGDSVILCIHMNSVSKFIVTVVCSNNLNVVRDRFICFSVV